MVGACHVSTSACYAPRIAAAGRGVADPRGQLHEAQAQLVQQDQRGVRQLDAPALGRAERSLVLLLGLRQDRRALALFKAAQSRAHVLLDPGLQDRREQPTNAYAFDSSTF